MVRLQSITRKNKSVVHFVNLPKEELEKSGFQKGDELEVKCIKEGKIIVRKHK